MVYQPDHGFIIREGSRTDIAANRTGGGHEDKPSPLTHLHHWTRVSYHIILEQSGREVWRGRVLSSADPPEMAWEPASHLFGDGIEVGGVPFQEAMEEVRLREGDEQVV